MKRLIVISVVGAAALMVGIAVAATGSSGSASAATVSIKQVPGLGKVLVDSKGQALYSNDQDHGVKVLCKSGCLVFWKPLTVKGTPKGASLPGKLGVVVRPGGVRQVTYNGKGLYTFTLDKGGKVTGDGFTDAFAGQRFTWHVAHTGKLLDTSGGSTYREVPGY
jgi:predicted lipoprotein with Yx(FWY)xxD motif